MKSADAILKVAIDACRSGLLVRLSSGPAAKGSNIQIVIYANVTGNVGCSLAQLSIQSGFQAMSQELAMVAHCHDYSCGKTVITLQVLNKHTVAPDTVASGIDVSGRSSDALDALATGGANNGSGNPIFLVAASMQEPKLLRLMLCPLQLVCQV